MYLSDTELRLLYYFQVCLPWIFTFHSHHLMTNLLTVVPVSDETKAAVCEEEQTLKDVSPTEKPCFREHEVNDSSLSFDAEPQQDTAAQPADSCGTDTHQHDTHLDLPIGVEKTPNEEGTESMTTKEDVAGGSLSLPLQTDEVTSQESEHGDMHQPTDGDVSHLAKSVENLPPIPKDSSTEQGNGEPTRTHADSPEVCIPTEQSSCKKVPSEETPASSSNLIESPSECDPVKEVTLEALPHIEDHGTALTATTPSLAPSAPQEHTDPAEEESKDTSIPTSTNSPVMIATVVTSTECPMATTITSAGTTSVLTTTSPCSTSLSANHPALTSSPHSTTSPIATTTLVMATSTTPIVTPVTNMLTSSVTSQNHSPPSTSTDIAGSTSSTHPSSSELQLPVTTDIPLVVSKVTEHPVREAESIGVQVSQKLSGSQSIDVQVAKSKTALHPIITSASTEGQFSHALSNMAQMHRSSLEAFNPMPPLHLATLMRAGLPPPPYSMFSQWGVTPSSPDAMKQQAETINVGHANKSLDIVTVNRMDICPQIGIKPTPSPPPSSAGSDIVKTTPSLTSISIRDVTKETKVTPKAHSEQVNKIIMKSVAPSKVPDIDAKSTDAQVASSNKSLPSKAIMHSPEVPTNKITCEPSVNCHTGKECMGEEEQPKVNHGSVQSTLKPMDNDRGAATKVVPGSKGISILKPLQDRELEVEDVEMVTTPDMKKVKALKPPLEQVNDLEKKVHMSNLVPQKASLSQFTVAKMLDAPFDRPRNHQIVYNAQKTIMQDVVDKVEPEVVEASHGVPSPIVAPPSADMAVVSMAPVHQQPSRLKGHKNAVKTHTITVTSAIELPNHSSIHLTNFVQKSLNTPTVVVNSAHPITSPGFPHNLTESVQKVMKSLPLDVTPPTSPNYRVIPSVATVNAVNVTAMSRHKSPPAQKNPCPGTGVNRREEKSPTSVNKTVKYPSPVGNKCVDYDTLPLTPQPPLQSAIVSPPAVVEQNSPPASSLSVLTTHECTVKQEHPSPSSSDSSFVSEHSYSARPPSGGAAIGTVISPRKLSPGSQQQSPISARRMIVVKAEPHDSSQQLTIKAEDPPKPHTIITNTMDSVEVSKTATQIRKAPDEEKADGVVSVKSSEDITSGKARGVKRKAPTTPTGDGASASSVPVDASTADTSKAAKVIKRSPSTDSQQSVKEEMPTSTRPSRSVCNRSNSTESQQSCKEEPPIGKPARVTRRRSRESTESQKSTGSVSKRDESPKVTSTPLRTRSRGTSESSDRRTPTPTPADCSSRGQRATRGGSSERSVSPVPSTTGRMATRSSGRKQTTSITDTQVPQEAAAGKVEEPNPAAATTSTTTPASKPTRGSKRKLLLTDDSHDKSAAAVTTSFVADATPVDGQTKHLESMSSDDDVALSELRARPSPIKAAGLARPEDTVEERPTPRGKKNATGKGEGNAKVKPATKNPPMENKVPTLEGKPEFVNQ